MVKLPQNYEERIKTDDLNNNNSHPKTILIIIRVLNAPLMLISIIGNSGVLATILRAPSLRSPTTVFLCSLAVSDLLVGLVVQPVYIADALKPGHSSTSHARKTLTPIFCGVSLCTMAAISVGRLTALHYHLRYPTLTTAKRALHILTTLFSCLSFWNLKIFPLTIAVLVAIGIFICIICYIRIYRVVHHLSCVKYKYWSLSKHGAIE